MHACPTCRRHIRDDQCPFCEATALAPEPAADAPVSRMGLTRSVLVATVLTASGCAPTPPYGIPQDAVAVDSADDTDAPTFVAAYGIPPRDAGTE